MYTHIINLIPHGFHGATQATNIHATSGYTNEDGPQHGAGGTTDHRPQTTSLPHLHT